MSAWHRPDVETAAMEYLTRAVGDETGARQIVDGLLARGRAIGHVAGLREAAEMVGNDDACGCGGCDSCAQKEAAADVLAHADRLAAALGGITGGER